MEDKNLHKIPEVPVQRMFRTPDHYFDELPTKVMSNIETSNLDKGRILFLKYLKPVAGLAASFAIVLLLVYFPFKIFSPGITDNNNIINIDQEYFLVSSMNDHAIYESLESDSSEVSFNMSELEQILLSSADDYDLIGLIN